MHKMLAFSFDDGEHDVPQHSTLTLNNQQIKHVHLKQRRQTPFDFKPAVPDTAISKKYCQNANTDSEYFLKVQENSFSKAIHNQSSSNSPTKKYQHNSITRNSEDKNNRFSVNLKNNLNRHTQYLSDPFLNSLSTVTGPVFEELAKSFNFSPLLHDTVRVIMTPTRTVVLDSQRQILEQRRLQTLQTDTQNALDLMYGFDHISVDLPSPLSVTPFLQTEQPTDNDQKSNGRQNDKGTGTFNFSAFDNFSFFNKTPYSQRVVEDLRKTFESEKQHKSNGTLEFMNPYNFNNYTKSHGRDGKYATKPIVDPLIYIMNKIEIHLQQVKEFFQNQKQNKASNDKTNENDTDNNNDMIYDDTFWKYFAINMSEPLKLHVEWIPRPAEFENKKKPLVEQAVKKAQPQLLSNQPLKNQAHEIHRVKSVKRNQSVKQVKGKKSKKSKSYKYTKGSLYGWLESRSRRFSVTSKVSLKDIPTVNDTNDAIMKSSNDKDITTTLNINLGLSDVNLNNKLECIRPVTSSDEKANSTAVKAQNLPTFKDIKNNKTLSPDLLWKDAINNMFPQAYKWTSATAALSMQDYLVHQRTTKCHESNDSQDFRSFQTAVAQSQALFLVTVSKDHIEEAAMASVENGSIQTNSVMTLRDQTLNSNRGHLQKTPQKMQCLILLCLDSEDIQTISSSVSENTHVTDGTDKPTTYIPSVNRNRLSAVQLQDKPTNNPGHIPPEKLKSQIYPNKNIHNFTSFKLTEPILNHGQLNKSRHPLSSQPRPRQLWNPHPVESAVSQLASTSFPKSKSHKWGLHQSPLYIDSSYIIPHSKISQVSNLYDIEKRTQSRPAINQNKGLSHSSLDHSILFKEIQSFEKNENEHDTILADVADSAGALEMLRIEAEEAAARQYTEISTSSDEICEELLDLGHILGRNRDVSYLSYKNNTNDGVDVTSLYSQSQDVQMQSLSSPTPVNSKITNHTVSMLSPFGQFNPYTEPKKVPLQHFELPLAKPVDLSFEKTNVYNHDIQANVIITGRNNETIGTANNKSTHLRANHPSVLSENSDDPKDIPWDYQPTSSHQVDYSKKDQSNRLLLKTESMLCPTIPDSEKIETLETSSLFEESPGSNVTESSVDDQLNQLQGSGFGSDFSADSVFIDSVPNQNTGIKHQGFATSFEHFNKSDTDCEGSKTYQQIQNTELNSKTNNDGYKAECENNKTVYNCKNTFKNIAPPFVLFDNHKTNAVMGLTYLQSNHQDTKLTVEKDKKSSYSGESHEKFKLGVGSAEISNCSANSLATSSSSELEQMESFSSVSSSSLPSLFVSNKPLPTNPAIPLKVPGNVPYTGVYQGPYGRARPRSYARSIARSASRNVFANSTTEPINGDTRHDKMVSEIESLTMVGSSSRVNSTIFSSSTSIDCLISKNEQLQAQPTKNIPAENDTSIVDVPASFYHQLKEKENLMTNFGRKDKFTTGPHEEGISQDSPDIEHYTAECDLTKHEEQNCGTISNRARQTECKRLGTDTPSQILPPLQENDSCTVSINSMDVEGANAIEGETNYEMKNVSGLIPRSYEAIQEGFSCSNLEANNRNGSCSKRDDDLHNNNFQPVTIPNSSNHDLILESKAKKIENFNAKEDAKHSNFRYSMDSTKFKSYNNSTISLPETLGSYNRHKPAVNQPADFVKDTFKAYDNHSHTHNHNNQVNSLIPNNRGCLRSRYSFPAPHVPPSHLQRQIPRFKDTDIPQQRPNSVKNGRNFDNSPEMKYNSTQNNQVYPEKGNNIQSLPSNWNHNINRDGSNENGFIKQYEAGKNNPKLGLSQNNSMFPPLPKTSNHSQNSWYEISKQLLPSASQGNQKPDYKGVQSVPRQFKESLLFEKPVNRMEPKGEEKDHQGKLSRRQRPISVYGFGQVDQMSGQHKSTAELNNGRNSLPPLIMPQTQKRFSISSSSIATENLRDSIIMLNNKDKRLVHRRESMPAQPQVPLEYYNPLHIDETQQQEQERENAEKKKRGFLIFGSNSRSDKKDRSDSNRNVKKEECTKTSAFVHSQHQQAHNGYHMKEWLEQQRYQKICDDSMINKSKGIRVQNQSEAPNSKTKGARPRLLSQQQRTNRIGSTLRLLVGASPVPKTTRYQADDFYDGDDDTDDCYYDDEYINAATLQHC